jgi:hypothetical protein
VKVADQSALPFSGHELPVAKDRVNRFKDSFSNARRSVLEALVRNTVRTWGLVRRECGEIPLQILLGDGFG